MEAKALEDPTTKYPKPPFEGQTQPWPGLASKMNPKPDHGEKSYIKRCGGTCIVQDPQEPDYPDMPKNALNQVKVDYCIAIAKMGGILARLVVRKPRKQKEISKEIQREAVIAERVLSDVASVNALGEQVPFNCPECGGVLWKIAKGAQLRYRCHTGHAYTAAALLAEQTKNIEETMWTVLRMFEERKNLLTTLAKDQSGA